MAKEIEGFALSQEELLAALVLAGLPALPGFDDLATLVFTTLSEEARIALLAAAERALVAHSYAYPAAQGVEIGEAITRVLEVCAHPDQTWVFLHQPVGQEQRVTYIHHSDRHWIAHVEMAGIHQWIRLAGREDVLATAHELLMPLAEVTGLEASGKVPETTFATLVATAYQSTHADLQTRLYQDGLASDVAKAFAETLTTQRSITAFARIDHVAESSPKYAFTVVVGRHSQWLLQMNEPGILGLQQVPAPVITQVLAELVSD